MRIGSYKQRVEIRRPTFEQNSFGESLETGFTELATRWASVRPLQGRELVNAQQVQSQISHEIKLLFDPSMQLRDTDYFVYKARRLNIAAPPINQDEADWEWVILCSEERKPTNIHAAITQLNNESTVEANGSIS